MGFGITSIEHALASVAQDIVKGAKAVDTFLQKATVAAGSAAPTIEALTQMINPAAVPLERAAFAALGLIAKAAADADAATAAKGLVITLDQQTLADFKAVYAQLSTKANFLAAGK